MRSNSRDFYALDTFHFLFRWSFLSVYLFGIPSSTLSFPQVYRWFDHTSVCFLQVNGNHETINIDGDFRYVDAGGYDECLDFLEHLNNCQHDWEKAFVSWASVSERLKYQKSLENRWGPWNLVKVDCSKFYILVFCITLWLYCLFLEMLL